jgi:hypothetical protein
VVQARNLTFAQVVPANGEPPRNEEFSRMRAG